MNRNGPRRTCFGLVAAGRFFRRTHMKGGFTVKTTLARRLKKDIKVNWSAYMMMLLLIIPFYVIFSYLPMGGIIIAFKNYQPRLGIFASKCVGLKHFQSFFGSVYFGRLLRNTLTISVCGLLFSFPCAILLALSINEVHNKRFKSAVQTISYMPHFISIIVVCSMLRLFLADKGVITQLCRAFGYSGKGSMLNDPNAFVPIYILSDIWQQTGWNCIIYLAAFAAIDPGLYEAARIDGANRWQQTLHVTLPGISRTIVLLLILRVGSLMSVGHEKIILLYNDFTMETGDVISSYVYRRGMIKGDYSFSTAVGLFNAVINFTLVLFSNSISNRISGYGIW